MRKRIIENIDNPDALEKIYRENKSDFTRVFAEISDEYDSDLIRFWKIRLANETEDEFRGFRKPDLLVVILLSLATGVLVKLPDIFSQIDAEFFYPRNLAILVFNGLILFTFWQNKIFDTKKVLIYGSFILILVLFVNFLPSRNSDSINVAFIHIPLFLWCLFGLTFISFDHKNTGKRIKFIRFNGELLIMTGLLLIAGGLLTGITVGLFSVINIDIERFYLENIAVFGGVAAPIVAYFLIGIYPNITRRITPVIARVFTPLVLVTLIIYLITMVFSNSKILEDRELLVVFNVLLLAVMAIIIFSVSELDKSKVKNVNLLILFALAVLAITVNSVALFAIITRVLEGLTPNRTTVLLSNILIFINLILIAKNLYLSYFKNEKIDSVERTVAKYLSVYWVYTILAIFILPFVFGLK